MTNKLVIGLLVIVVAVSGIALYQLVGPSQRPPSNESQQQLPNATEYRFSNEWLDKRNILVYGQPPLDYLRSVNATGMVWSAYWSGLNLSQEKYANSLYVESLHDNGFRVGANLPTVQGHLDLASYNPALLERASCRGLNGSASYCNWITEVQVYFMCHNNPEWQEFLETRAREGVDGKADVILIDEIEGTGGHEPDREDPEAGEPRRLGEGTRVYATRTKSNLRCTDYL